MDKKIKKAIILKDVHSNLFEEIIFVVRTETINQAQSINLVHEARKIVSNYVDLKDNKFIYEEQSYFEFNKAKKINRVLNISLVLSIVLFALLVINLY